MLLEKGSDVSVVSEAGETAHDWARKFGAREVILGVGQNLPTPAAAPQPPRR